MEKGFVLRKELITGEKVEAIVIQEKGNPFFGHFI